MPSLSLGKQVQILQRFHADEASCLLVHLTKFPFRLNYHYLVRCQQVKL